MYYSQLATRYLYEDEIGTISNFLNALDSEESVLEFYLNLRKYGFLSSEIGTADEFWESVKSDFETKK